MYTYIYAHICMHTYRRTYNEILVEKKNEIMPFAATWMDLESSY